MKQHNGGNGKWVFEKMLDDAGMMFFFVDHWLYCEKEKNCRDDRSAQYGGSVSLCVAAF